MPVAQRLPYFMGFAGTLWGVSLVTTGFGFALAGAVPLPVTLGLVFINPIYFMLMTAADVRSRARVLAAVLGAAGGPALYLLTPDWSLLLAGVGAGTLGFLLGGGFRRRV
jgi:predicted branched-subunit amino acid permease